jgi:predicted DNA-binding transcriptional regulator AlpA
MKINPDTTEKTFLTSAQLRTRYGGRSHMWLERRLKSDPLFPRPQYFGRLRFWDRAAIEAWERATATGRPNVAEARRPG